MNSTSTTCISCRKLQTPSKGFKTCGLCEEAVCKDCSVFLEALTFEFLATVPDELSHTDYCAGCYSTAVEPALNTYRETMELAQGVFVFFVTQKRKPTLLKKANTPVSIESCEDRDKTILRLAFYAAQQGHNAIMNTEVVAKKLRNYGYQKTEWRGTGLPVTVDGNQVDREAERDEW
jgi:hypothetical protein